MTYSFIVNPHSGKKKSINISNLIESKTKTLTKDIFKTEYPGHAFEIAENAMLKGVNNIIAVGGDGTMNEVARALVNSNANFGLIPMGSGNGFARSLRLPLDPESALKIILKGKTENIDVGTINAKYFFAVSGVGLDAKIAAAFQKSKSRGALPYFYNGLKEFLNYSYPEFLLKADKESRISPLLITIANAQQFGNGAFIAPSADLKDGFLDVCLLERMTVIQALLNIYKLFNGKIATSPFFKTFKTTNIEIGSDDKEILFHTDGEPHISKGNIKIGIIPQSLSVLIP